LRTLGTAALAIFLACGDFQGPPAPNVNPSNLVVEVTGILIATAAWSECTDADFQRYILYRSLEPNIILHPEDAETLGVFNDAGTTYYAHSIGSNTWYYYALETKDTDGLGAWSPEDSIYSYMVPTVTDLALSSQSSGRNIMLDWNDIPEVDGYRVFFKQTEQSDWLSLGDTPESHFTDTATVAGYYAVKAFSGNDFSLFYSNIVNTLPLDVTSFFVLFDEWTSPDTPDAFIFGPDSGSTGSAADTSFIQDIFARETPTDAMEISLFSGAAPPFESGNETFLGFSTYTSYCPEYGSGGWQDSLEVDVDDRRVFLYLSDGSYVKMYDITLGSYPAGRANLAGTVITFSYEMQPGGLSVFTMK